MPHNSLAPLTIALAGYGTVGSGLARILHEHKEHIIARTGREIRIVAILVRDLTKQRAYDIPDNALITSDIDTFLTTPADVVVELMGGIDTAFRIIEHALTAGRHVVTANKALLAEKGEPLFQLAAAQNLHLGFEASVCGGIPIIQTMREGLAANRITSLMGILNGTSNYILSEMRAKGLPFQEVLHTAQALGYAEADPTLDIEGIDAAHKLAILIYLAWGSFVPFHQLPVQGITTIFAEDISYAHEFGYTLKLVGQARLHDGEIEAGMFPTLVPHDTLLAKVDGAFNAIHVEGDAVGPIFLHGKGAGDLPTGSAVAADLFAIARGVQPNNTGFAQPEALSPPCLLPAEKARQSFYIRLQLPDAPGVLRDVATVMASHAISIAQAIQKDHAGCSACANTTMPSCVPFIIMTHEAPVSAITAALDTLAKKGLLHQAPVFYRVIQSKK